MEIPKSFKLGKNFWKVLVRSTRRTLRGRTYVRENGIVVAGWLPPRARAETFWHEVTHAILHDMSHPLWKDEKFVEAFSKRLNQIVHTAEL